MRPMLAETATEAHLQALLRQGPLLASAKLDGIRAIKKDGKLLSRSLKPIRNHFVQRRFASLPEGFDGELILGDPTAKDCYLATNSAVMSFAGEPQDVAFWLFDDWFHPNVKFAERYETLRLWHEAHTNLYPGPVKLVEQAPIHTMADLLAYEEECLDLGFEGLIIRRPNSPYKYNRSTLRESFMLKLKRFVDGEAEVIGWVQKFHNANSAELDERGFTKRSKAQDGLVPLAELGALLVRDLTSGVEFEIGTGFTQAQREAIWDERETYLGKIAKYKHFPCGVKDKPRHPVWLGWRNSDDMDYNPRRAIPRGEE